MRIPSRAQVDAFCGSPATRYQRIASILAPALLLGTIVYILLVWRSLPERIPINYNMAGEITGYGGRGTLLVMPIFGLVTDLVIALVGRFPKSWNTGVRVTVLNRVRVYRLARDLLADLRLGMAILFGSLAIYHSLMPEHYRGIFVAFTLLLIFVPVLRYFIRVIRAR